ncbi:Phytochrome A [Glycine soja]|uniref:Phytochrome A n=1 Tax=Glycine soja TaxID=3848 RepID=A0A0B2Q2J3_GLYSO|nr:Phytochrome A [Glycine soja]
MSSSRLSQSSSNNFMENKVRMIVDCCAKNVKVIQDKKIPFDLALYGSTLRAAHSCHLQFMVNMNSSASLVLAVVINDNDEDGNSSDDAAVQQPHKSSEEEEERNVQFEINTYDFKIDSGPASLVVNACASRDLQDNIVGVCFVAQGITAQKTMMEKFPRIEGDYKAIVQNPNPSIPPLFSTDEFGWCCEWNSAMAKLTGWKREEVMDKMLLGEIFGTQIAGCRLRNHEAVVNFSIVLNTAMAVTGVFCFLQLASPELQQALHIQLLSEQTAMKRLKDLNYLKRQIRNPLYGIMFSRKLLEGTELGAEQKQFLQMSTQCQHQLSKILDDSDLDSIIDGITHDGFGVPETLLNQMFGRDGHESEEGISMLISRKLMKGDVRYIREAGKIIFHLIC